MRLHPIRTTVLAILGLGVVAAAWFGWTAYKVADDLGKAVDDAGVLETAARSGDEAAMQTALDSLQEHSESADRRASGWSWSVLTHVPSFGDDAEGVRTVSDVVATLSSGGLDDLANALENLDQVAPAGGQISIEALRDLQAPVTRGRDALQVAGDQLATEDPSGYITRLRDEYRSLATKVADAERALRAADTALAVMPSMLGESEERNYLFVVQNNAEVRATGGIPGAISLIKAQDGQIRLERQSSTADVFRAPSPVLPLTPEERKLYGPQLGVFFLDSNFTPDFPRTADLMRASWARVYPEPLDGVLSIDAVATSYLLGVTGPVNVDGIELNQDNAVDELLHNSYVRLSDPNAQDAFFAAAAEAMFNRLTSGVPDPTALFQALARAAGEHRIYVHSFDEGEQTELTGTSVAGELTPTPSDVPLVDVTMNDTTGSKMSYFMRSQVAVKSTSCQAGIQRLAGSAEIRSVAPADAANLPAYITGDGIYGIEPGSELVTVRVFGPVGGTVSKMRLNYERTDVDMVRQDDRDVATFYVFLKPGSTVSIEWQMESGPQQTGNARVRVTPGIEPRSSSTTAVSSCR